jgi:capsular exopolysaccharide synthesis family protein
MAEENTELEKSRLIEDAPLVRPGYPRNAGYPEGMSYGYGEPDDGIHLRDIWRTIYKYKLLIIVLTVVVTTLVSVEVYRDKSIYQATATIEIGKDEQTIVRFDDQYMPSNEYSNYLSIKTNMLKLTSRPILERVAKSLKLDENSKFLETRRRSISDAVSVIMGKAREMTKSNEEAVNETSPLIEQNQEIDISAEESKRLSPIVKTLLAGITVEQVPDTRALKVSFTHTDPQIAANVANGVAKDFIERNFKRQTERYTNTSDWLDKTTRELEAKVQRADKELADYMRDHNLYSVDEKETLTSDKLSRMHQQVIQAEANRIMKESMYEQVKAGKTDKLPEEFTDAKIADRQKKLEELQIRAAQLDEKFGPENPNVLDTKKQIAVLQTQITASIKALEEKVKVDYDRALREERSLVEALERAKSEASQQNQSLIQFGILKENLETAKKLYTDLLQKYNHSQIQRAEQQNNMNYIEPAEIPGGPIGPFRLRIIIMAFFMGLLGGVIVAFTLNYLDNTVKTVEDINRYTQLPALGVIPKMIRENPRNGSQKQIAIGGNASQLVAFDKRSTAAEAYRALRTSVLLSSAGTPPKILLVTSGQPGEGKTTTIVNSGISLAQLGASVLIIDCDLRKPAVHKFFDIDNTRGLSTYLSRDIPIDSVIQNVSIKNLSIIPSGAIPPNPAELVSSERMRDMLKTLSEKYDHILIDSPPLINVTDPVILSTLVNGVILVVQGGRSKREVVRRARQELANVGAKIFGVVLNNVDLRREGYDYYYHYRYYSDYYGQEKVDGVGD